MRILSIDTATPCCSVALAEDGVVRAAAVDAGGVTHSRHLMGLVDAVLASAGWRLSQIDGFGVTRGPGSFTGIRIGMSAVMGMAQAVERPVVGVSALETLAWPLLQGGAPVCALIDARRREVYCGVYRLAGEGQGALETLVPDQVITPVEALAQVPDPCHFVGSGARLYRREIIEARGPAARFAPEFQTHPDAAVVAWLAERRLPSQGQGAGDLRPLYLRKSDAQINRESVVRTAGG